MIESKKTVILPFPISEVWNIVIDNHHTAWRSDVDRVEIKGNTFTEYTKQNFATQFTITKMVPKKQYEFDLENKNMHGHWIGTFEVVNNTQTKLELTEQLVMHNKILRFVAPFYLKHQQKIYIRDLKKELQSRNGQ